MIFHTVRLKSRNIILYMLISYSQVLGGWGAIFANFWQYIEKLISEQLYVPRKPKKYFWGSLENFLKFLLIFFFNSTLGPRSQHTLAGQCCKNGPGQGLGTPKIDWLAKKSIFSKFEIWISSCNHRKRNMKMMLLRR